MDLGKILRERAKIRTYVNPPKKPGKRWGVYPSTKVEQDIFTEEDDFRCTVLLFSYERNEIEKMQQDAIDQAALGFKKGAWIFWLHAANHGIEEVPGMYRSTINFVFRIRFPKNRIGGK